MDRIITIQRVLFDQGHFNSLSNEFVCYSPFDSKVLLSFYDFRNLSRVPGLLYVMLRMQGCLLKSFWMIRTLKLNWQAALGSKTT